MIGDDRLREDRRLAAAAEEHYRRGNGDLSETMRVLARVGERSVLCMVIVGKRGPTQWSPVFVGKTEIGSVIREGGMWRGLYRGRTERDSSLEAASYTPVVEMLAAHAFRMGHVSERLLHVVRP